MPGDWAAVKKVCVKARYQPVLLLYEIETKSGQEMIGKSPNKDVERHVTQQSSVVGGHSSEGVPLTKSTFRGSEGESKYEVMLREQRVLYYESSAMVRKA